MKTGLKILIEASTLLNGGKKVTPTLFYNDRFNHFFDGAKYSLKYEIKKEDFKKYSFIIKTHFRSSDFKELIQETIGKYDASKVKPGQCMMIHEETYESCLLLLSDVENVFMKKEKEFNKKLFPETLYSISYCNLELSFPYFNGFRKDTSSTIKNDCEIAINKINLNKDSFEVKMQQLAEASADMNEFLLILKRHQNDLNELFSFYSKLNAELDK